MSTHNHRHNHVTVEPDYDGNAVLKITRHDRVRDAHREHERNMERLKSFWLWFSTLCVFYTVISVLMTLGGANNI